MYQAYSELYDVEELLALARMDLQEKNYQESLWKLKLALTKPDNDEAYALIGRVYAQIGLYNKAQKAYENYIENNPEAVLERFQHGMVMFDSGDLEKACATWQDLLEVSPNYPPALYYIAVSMVQLGDKESAMQFINTLKSVAQEDNYYVNLSQELEQQISDSDVQTASSATPVVVNESGYKTGSIQ